MATNDDSTATAETPRGEEYPSSVLKRLRENLLQPPTDIGPFHVLQEIGEGGMGVVYEAEQRHPIERKVALKLIKLGMDTKQVVARFEAERQALAMMDHPNIAKVFEAGATELGRPYFVMELVRGVPITEYCDQNRHTPRQRLELFLPVCDAIRHAHQKGVIHRDIKPSNVLVTLHDGKPVPKVIDFGVAKATQLKLTDKTLVTEYRQLIGTPEYMSPEQAGLSGSDVDTGSDIYSLGVLLYELLTGTTPFHEHKLRSMEYEQMQRILLEEDPPKPSKRIESRRAKIGAAAQRDIEARRLEMLVRGELDWIVMKCLEKDRTRRYDTASSLAADVKNYLEDRAVTAAPPSAGYHVKQFGRRHKVGLGVASVVAIGLLAALGVTLWGLNRANRGWREASRQRDQFEGVAQFLTGTVIPLADPLRLGRKGSLRDLVDHAAVEAEHVFRQTPWR